MVGKAGLKAGLIGTAVLLVMTAINLSLGLSMIRVAITPAALHPNPIIMLRDCFPWAPALRNRLSRLKATRGR